MGNTPPASSSQPLVEQSHPPGTPLNMRTLRLSAPFGQTPGLTVVVLLLLLASGEVVARTPAFQSQLSAPSLGDRHVHLEIQLHQLRSVVRREGEIKCIALGNSMVWLGFDPVAFNQAYRDHTGSDLGCYTVAAVNFHGVEGSRSAPIATTTLARVTPQRRD